MIYFWACAPGTAATPTVGGEFTVQGKDIILIPDPLDATGIHNFMEIISSIVYCIANILAAW